MSAALVKLQSTPDLVEQVHRALLDAISTGALAPGQRLTQEDIARQLAVSRQPVLQALRLLRQDGLLLDAPGRGVLVAPIDPAAITQVYQVREALDVLAARLAAQRRQPIAPAFLERGRAAAAGGDMLALIEADLAFHQAIYAAAGNPLIAQSATLHWWHVRRAMGLVLQRSALRRPVWDEHAAIAAAIAVGDVERAGALMAAHDQNASAHMQAQLGQAHLGQEQAPAQAQQQA
jgi:DNA-binding GntR family transcriptional regulator